MTTETMLSDSDVLLSCNHILHFPNTRVHKKEVLYCNRCKTERTIKALGRGNAFRVKCETCSYTRGKGGLLSAETAAAGHRGKKIHHVVHVLNSADEVVRTFQNESDVILPLTDEPPY